MIGFLLGGFSGLINLNLKGYARTLSPEVEGEIEPQQYPEA